MNLWLVRHAQPLVPAGVCYGALDLPADPQQTRQAALALAQTLPKGLLLRSSLLQRCKHLTLELQALRPDFICQFEADLSELDFGCHEGQRWDAIATEVYAVWMADFARHRFGGAESVSEFMLRVKRVWQAAQARAQDEIWVTHAGVIRAAGLLAQGVHCLNDPAAWPAEVPAFGQSWCLAMPGDSITHPG